MKFSASTFVLILFSVTACIGLMTKMLETKDWMMVAGMVFSFFFTKTMPQGNSQTVEKEVK